VWFELQVLAPYDSEDARGLLKAAIRDPDPVIFLENELLYGQAFPVSQEVRSAGAVAVATTQAQLQCPGICCLACRSCGRRYRGGDSLLQPMPKQLLLRIS
jgi:hypothetical protein